MYQTGSLPPRLTPALQAANIQEALEAGARTLLVDEDTSATNFMIRDARMQVGMRGPGAGPWVGARLARLDWQLASCQPPAALYGWMGS